MKELYEKLGLFYLGTSVEDKRLTLLKNKDLTTHAAIIGMTGSGKTGLAIGLIEEAMIDNIPAIIIDPKGDMGNLCLRSPHYEPKDFEPWVGEAKAEATAAMWKKGIESAHQDLTRSERLSQTPVSIYTPGSSAGISVNILDSLNAPSDEILSESDLFSAYLGSTVASLLALIGEESAMHSKTYTFLSTLIASFWHQGETVTLERLIGAIITPPFEKVGFLPLDDFFSSKERYALATRFNSVVANPAFAQWLEGVALDIDTLLYDAHANAKVSIFSIAHLNDSQRMFFVTMLLNRYVAWMRRQSGTTALRTLLYMDEIYGYFPPSRNPPSKTPMMLLLKQARAFGVGVVLSTQNPVDLDYKGLSNIGTWFIGRLQTRQDIDKVIEGLSGKLGSEYSQDDIRTLLGTLDKRVFFLKSAHREHIERFATRWVLSYLKGPLKRDEIMALMQKQKVALKPLKKPAAPAPKSHQNPLHVRRDAYHLQLDQYFEGMGNTELSAVLLLKASIYYHNAAKGIDTTLTYERELALDEREAINFEHAEPSDAPSKHYPTSPPHEALFAPLPSELLQRESAKILHQSLTDYLYNNHALTMYRVRSRRFDSKAFESLEQFTLRFKTHLQGLKAEALDTLQERYAKKVARLDTQLQRATQRLEKEQDDVSAKTTDTLVSTGLAILGAFFGSRATGRFGTAINKGGRLGKERRDVTKAEAAIETLKERYELLQAELEAETDTLERTYALEAHTIEPYRIRPKKRDISVTSIALLWR